MWGTNVNEEYRRYCQAQTDRRLIVDIETFVNALAPVWEEVRKGKTDLDVLVEIAQGASGMTVTIISLFIVGDEIILFYAGMQEFGFRNTMMIYPSGTLPQVLENRRNAQGVAKPGIELNRQLGKEGEDGAGIINAKERIPSLSNTAKDQIPDELLHDQKILREIKNVSSQSYTKQLRDFNDWANKNGYQFILEVRSGAKLSGPLQEAINNGDVILKNIGQ